MNVCKFCFTIVIIYLISVSILFPGRSNFTYSGKLKTFSVCFVHGKQFYVAENLKLKIFGCKKILATKLVL